MSCDACALAATDPRTGHIHFPCPECIARSLAQSPAYFDSIQRGEPTKTYSAALRHFFPDILPSQAHARVGRWADLIHSAEATKQGKA